MINRNRTLSLLAVTTLLALTACGTGASADSADVDHGGGSQGEESNIVVANTSTTYGPKDEVAMLAVPEAMGYFEEEGLSVEMIMTDGSTAAVQAVASGNADIAAPDAGSALAAVEGDTDMKMIGNVVQNYPWQMATLPNSDIEAPADLKGKKIGVISLASGSAPFARSYVEDAGLDPETDVELLPVGVGAQAAAALANGDVDVLALFGQAYVNIEHEGTELKYLDNPAFFDSLKSLTFSVTNENLAAHSEVYEGYMRAAYKGLLFSTINPEAAMQMGYEVLPQLLDGSSQDERLEKDTESLAVWLESTAPDEGDPGDWEWGNVNSDEWEVTQDFTVSAGQLNSVLEESEFWDPSLLQAANDFDREQVIQDAENWTP
jgi:NitT/TauT family transport system substrate-binding protein